MPVSVEAITDHSDQVTPTLFKEAHFRVASIYARREVQPFLALALDRENVDGPLFRRGDPFEVKKQRYDVVKDTLDAVHVSPFDADVPPSDSIEIMNAGKFLYVNAAKLASRQT